MVFNDFVREGVVAKCACRPCLLTCDRGNRLTIRTLIRGAEARSSATARVNSSTVCDGNAIRVSDVQQRLATIHADAARNHGPRKMLRCPDRLVLPGEGEMGNRTPAMSGLSGARGLFGICVGEQSPARSLGRAHLQRTVSNAEGPKWK